MIIYQFFEGCPNADETYANLMHLVNEGVITPSEIEIIKVDTAAEAEEKNFQGSPTILVNGKDIYTEKAPEGFAYTCRVYTLEGRQTGVLPKEYILEKINRLK